MIKLISSCFLIIPLIVLVLVENGQCTFPFDFIRYPYCKPKVQGSPTAGAVYFQTNDPNSNAILVSAIKTDGTLTFSHSVLTWGKGGYSTRSDGTVPPGSPFVDSLFSQDAVIVGDNFLFAVNAGSNSVSMFSIHPRNPLILTFQCQRSSGGDFPIALAYSSSLKMLCVLNGGTNNGVQCFDVNTVIRVITPLPNTARSLTSEVTEANPPFGGFGTFSDILFTEESTQLLVSVKGNTATSFQGFIASYAVTGRELADLPIILRNGVIGAPFSMSIVPGTEGKTVAFGDTGFGLGAIRFEAGVWVTIAKMAIAGQVAICWSDASIQTNNHYFVDAVGRLYEISIGRSASITLNFVKLYNMVAPTIDARIASLPDKDYIYVLSPAPGSVQVRIFSLDGPGDAKPLTPLVVSAAELKQKCGTTMTSASQGMAVFVTQV